MKKKKGLVIALISLIVIVGGVLFFIFRDSSTKLSSLERKWISDNESKVQNVTVINNSNIFGNLGEGVYYSYLNDFMKEYNLKLNNITMNRNESSSGIIFNVGNQMPENSFLFYEDHFVLVSTSKELISSSKNITNKKIGILEKDSNYVKNYLKATTNTFTVFNTETELWNALSDGTVTHVIVPRIEYLSKILSKNYFINYHFSDLKRYYFVEDSSNSTLFGIMKKYSIKWLKNSFVENFNTEERALFQSSLNISDKDLANLQKSNIVYGYKVHTPYEVYGDRAFGGIFAKYLKTFSDFAGVEIKYSKYNNEKKMVKDLNNNKITMYANYDSSMNNGTIVDTFIPLTYDVIAHESNEVVIESKETLKNYTLYVEENTLLYQNLASVEGLQLKTYKASKIEDVLRDKKALLAMDKNVTTFLQKSILNRHTVRYEETLPVTYAIRSLGSDTLNTLLSKYMNSVDPHEFITSGYYSAVETESRGSIMNSIAKYALYGVLIIGIILLLIYRSSKKVRMQKKVKKEDRLKYIDQLTSLKNRNYLNENMSSWNKNTIYPQSIIMIDLDKVQEINDTLGYEEGDRQIKSAANSLIKTQLDNTDIIRTNGNEFVVYLVGYNQKQITSYLNKLKKEFKSLPYDYGVTVSYSMIETNLKSIEDALNECIEDIKKQKENKKEEEK